jgi:hypothetical protein
MRLAMLLLWALSIAFTFVSQGCKNFAEASGPEPWKARGQEVPECVKYAPAEIDIMPLTRFAGVGSSEPSKMELYVSLLDSFGSQIKAPGVFRFELYEHVSRSAQPKGRRVSIWPDIDLSDPMRNNSYWRDFLRAYEFNLDFEPTPGQSYILQVTCLCAGGKRISAEAPVQ